MILSGIDAARKGGRIEKEEAARQQGGLFVGRIVPTEAKPSELSGEILSLGRRGVKAKSGALQPA